MKTEKSSILMKDTGVKAEIKEIFRQAGGEAKVERDQTGKRTGHFMGQIRVWADKINKRIMPLGYELTVKRTGVTNRFCALDILVGCEESQTNATK